MVQVTVGYAGGQEADPSYQHIKDHTEAVRIEFDPRVVSYEELLQIFFQQVMGALLTPAFSRQYRLLLLVHSEQQREAVQRQLGNVRELLHVGPGESLCVDVESATDFYRAEEYHQKYLDKNELGMFF